MSRSDGCWRRRTAPASVPATSWPASSGDPIRSPVRPVHAASGTSAATGGTPSAASRSMDGYGAERWRVDPYYAVTGPGPARTPRRTGGARQHPRQGVGAGGPGRRSRSWYGAGARARHRGRSDRSARRSDRRPSAGTPYTCWTGSRTGRSLQLVRALGGTYLTDLADLHRRPGRGDRGDRSRAGRVRLRRSCSDRPVSCA